jgi:hypothetical protein
MDLSYTFKDLYTRVSKYLGTGRTPSGVALSDVQDIVNRAYKQFLFPVVQVGANLRHWKWSFLEHSTQLICHNGVTNYNMPRDFGSMITDFTYTLQDNKLITALKQIDEASMLRLQAFNAGNGEPLYYCIRPTNADASQICHHEVLLYPIPNGDYTFAYSYDRNPPKLENDDDIPVGAVEMSECLLQLCLAVAEQEQDEVIGVQSQLAGTMLIAAVQLDKERNASATVGSNSDSADNVAIRLPPGFVTGDWRVKGYNVFP